MNAFIQCVATLLTILTILTINSLLAALPENIEPYLQEGDNVVTEDGLLPPTPGTLEFVRALTASWRDVLGAITEIAPESRQQQLIVVAGEYLPPPEYLDFLNALCDLRLQGHLQPQALRSVLWAGLAKSGFLVFNFDHPEVVRVLDRIETQLSNDYPHDWNDFFSYLRSGKMKAELINERARNGAVMPEELSTFDATPYLQLSGGSVIADMRLIVKRPLKAVTSLASKNRTRWSMIVAFVVIICCVISPLLLLKFIQRAKGSKT